MKDLNQVQVLDRQGDNDKVTQTLIGNKDEEMANKIIQFIEGIRVSGRVDGPSTSSEEDRRFDWNVETAKNKANEMLVQA